MSERNKLDAIGFFQFVNKRDYNDEEGKNFVSQDGGFQCIEYQLMSYEYILRPKSRNTFAAAVYYSPKMKSQGQGRREILDGVKLIN